ncbi:MAG: protein kinase domain-containing protein [Ktedonobacteraceae bacterium]
MAIEELQDGRYHFVRSLGSGGMGEVYLMQDQRINRQVGIKVIRSEGASSPDSTAAKEAARLFQREAKAIAALEHPNILPLYDFGEEIRDGNTVTYMVMPYCTEGSLATWLRQRNSVSPLTLQDVAHLVEEAADALQYAHDQSVMHLDVKASNFLLRNNKKNPNRPTLLLADFGIARSSVTVASSSRTIRGTPSSMAPEQWGSNPVPATDQYALAVMTYEMMVGHAPFVGSMEQVMYQHFSAQPLPPSTYNPQLPPAVDSVILRALAKKPEDRFPSIADFAAAFDQATQSSPNLLLMGSEETIASDMHIRATLAISQGEAQVGTNRVITLPGGQHFNVTIPAGVSDGHIIRVQDQGDITPVLLTIAIKKPEQSSWSSNISSGSQPPIMANPNVRQLSNSASGPDLPTIASSDPNLRAPEKQSTPYIPQQQPPRRSRSVGIISGLIILVLVVLLAGGGFLFYNSHQSNNNSVSLTQTATSKLLTPTKNAGVTATPTKTQQNGLYIAGTYNGAMTDQTTQQTSQITLVLTQTQGNAALSGTFTYRSPTQATYPLSGTVDLQGNFSFTVQQPTGQTPLFFHGQVQQNQQGVYLHGNFCNSSTNSCSPDNGFFTVGPKF